MRIHPALALVLLASVAAGCGPKKPPKRAAPQDPESHSGPDGKRAGAQELKLGVVVTDSIAHWKGDRTDWRFFDIADPEGKLKAELHWDDVQTELTLELYDSVGKQVLVAPPTPGQLKIIELQPIEPGHYFLRVQGPEPSDDSSYSLVARWEDLRPPPPPIVDTGKPVDAPLPLPPGPVVEHVREPSEDELENSLQGRIVQNVSEGGALTLFIDKGSTAGVKVGTRGCVLEGSSGVICVKGSGFKITKIVDPSRSVGKARLKSLGSNRRVGLVVK